MDFYQTSEAFVIQNGKSSLQISRSNGDVSTVVSVDLGSTKPTKIHGLLGMMQLVDTKYLAVIKSVQSVGVIFGNHQVLNIQAVDWIPYESKDVPHPDDAQYLELLRSVVDSQAFYYCNTYDMTRSVQNWHTFEKVSREPMYMNADTHFFWNQSLSHDLIHAKAHDFVIPVIRGFVEIQNVKLKNGKSFKFSLMTRLGKKRVGTRYNVRGLDNEGNAANYAETEQVVETEKELLSFMLLRGSIPLYWSQKANLKYKPKFKFNQKLKSSDGFKLHIDDQINRYKNLVLVNLINLSGSEGVLAKAFETEHKNYGSDKVKYVEFDFHKKCKHTNYAALDELVTEIEQNVEDHKYFEYDNQSGAVKKEQAGIVRVNCIDCLDRTNVVESVFASHVLIKQLKVLGVIGENETMKQHPELEKVFKNGWADNGDVLSTLYAGTGALKSDFTRTGRRSLMGLANDGINSLTRYYLNNFTDGYKQDSVNLFLGKYKVNKTLPSPFNSGKNAFTLLNYAFFGALFMVALSTSRVVTGSSEHIFTNMRNAMLWIISLIIIVFIMMKNGRKIVNKPLLKARQH